ncbi:uncharacterized protein BJ171DRAFT_577476 [Polychytrium aggregatum]|uniref:uncharacterized protein n=1 Tax=Polychytrium aggregatum TaxID=110093 RepID=UPI0022FDCFDF|nr:uncharacterized protein BJ171DRAFT_577476 [Polychytrium aggregatum]KAI9209128.1 hypothetical protein BJ171DRAFT_577476 [Polychytrium aggregatum]
MSSDPSLPQFKLAKTDAARSEQHQSKVAEAVRYFLVALALSAVFTSLWMMNPRKKVSGSAVFELELEWTTRRPLIFIGDSVTRFQYLSLAYRLTYGHWQFEEPSFNATTKRIDREWGNWERFMRGTNALLKGNEVCDCYRNGTWDWRKTVEYIENRYFTTPYHNIAFYQAYDDHPGVCHTKGRLHPEEQSPYFDAPLDWCYTIPALLNHIDQTYGQSVIVLNLGIHNSSYVKWATAFAQHSNHSDSLLIWKQTTPSRDGKYAENKDYPLFEIFKSSKVVVMPTWRMLMDLYNANNSAVFNDHDNVHFQPQINKLMNQKLGELINRKLVS